MSQNFRFRSDEIHENEPGKDVRKLSDGNYRVYETDGHTRNVSFLLSNGKRKFLNYAYLVSVECSDLDDWIIVEFTSVKVLLQGLRLRSLYNDLFFHRPLEISHMDVRYNATVNENLPIINEIALITE